LAWNDGLQGPALQFAGSESRLLRALAGPGTGKTFALLRRLVRVIEAGVGPEEILVLTFARTAAEDIGTKLAEQGDERMRNVGARTLHSYCFSILTGQAFIRASGRNARILLEFERDYLLRGLEGPFSPNITERRELLQGFIAAWARLQSEEPGQPVVGLDQRFQDALLLTLRWHQGMLIGEVVPLALAYLRQNPAAPERARYRHVLVDEYQDLNRAEQVLVDLLAGEGSLAIIGDDDQSIYRTLKFANPEGIREFSNTHAGTEEVPFTECRRCPQPVVTMAQTLIQRNPGRIRGPLTAREGNHPGEVHNVQWQSIGEEAEGIATFIAHHVAQGINPGKILVLAPTRSIGYAIRDAVSQRNIEIRSFFREEAVEVKTAQERLTLLTLLAQPGDRVALRAWIGLGADSAYVGGYRRLLAMAQAENTDIRAVLDRLDRGEITIPHSGPPLERWRLLQQELRRLEPFRNDLERLIEEILPEAPDGHEDDLALLRSTAIAALNEEPRPQLRDLPDRIRYRIGQPDVPLETPYARVMSFHKSKGLTADLVVLSGLVDGAMPRVKDTDPPAERQAQLEEQRRLFFVGMTRTTRILVFSGYATLPDDVVRTITARLGRRLGRSFTVFPSPFLEECGPTLLPAIGGPGWIGRYR
jgi:DNA helicase-2/ATP-dependent DNA helicase PcrA